MNHPLTRSFLSKIAGAALFVIVSALYAGFLVQYSHVPSKSAGIDALFSTGLLAVAGYFLWFFEPYIKAVQARIFLAFAVAFLCLGGSYLLCTVWTSGTEELFPQTVPFRLVYTLFCWILLSQLYRIIRTAELSAEAPAKQVPLIPDEQVQTSETLDRITVKNGSHIHILAVESLHYIQADGDYATFVTESGKYLKEITLKYLEQHLPRDLFVRIHRSYIVHVQHIVRIELTAKETYCVVLRDGTRLRASSNGYRLLRQRLAL